MAFRVQTVKNADQSWTFSWTDTGASFYQIVLSGKEIAVVVGLTWTYQSIGFQSYPPPIEIAQENQLALSEAYKPYVLIQWYREDCSYYKVQKNTADGWITVSTLQESGSWVYSYVSQTLEDETTHEFRVIAVDETAGESEPRLYRISMVRPPDSPDGKIDVTYGSGITSLTVAAV